MLEKIIVILLKEHQGKVIGVSLGLIASILFLSFGFWRTLFVIICIALGYLVGKGLDENSSLDKWIKDLFRQ